MSDRTYVRLARPYARIVDTVTLADGIRVAIRPIRPDDAPRLQAAFKRLDPETRYRRFLAIKPHLSDGDARYLAGADGRDHVALVATPVDGSEEIIAVARFVRLRHDPRAAEFAIVVEDRFQGKGLGRALLERLVGEALARGVERFAAVMLSDNVAARRLFMQLAGSFLRHRRDGSLEELEFELAA